jgi:uncharacterized membrane protein
MKQSMLRALGAAFLAAAVVSVLSYIYYEHRAVHALAEFEASGRVDGATFAAFGYDGWITTVDSDTAGAVIPVNVSLRDGSVTPVTFSESFLSLLFVKWSRPIWLRFGIAFGIAALLAFFIPLGKHIVSLSGWFHVVFGSIILAGALVLKKYLGLDGLGGADSIQLTNLLVGPTIAFLGFWLTRESISRESVIASVKYLIVLFAIGGFLVSAMSWRVHNSADGSADIRKLCTAGEPWDCGIAERSNFSEIGGVPVAGIGAAGYMAFLLLLVFDGRRSRQILFALALGAICFSLYLSYGYSYRSGARDGIPFVHSHISDASRFTAAGDLIEPEDGSSESWWCLYCIISQNLLALILLIGALRLYLIKKEPDSLAPST